MTKVVARLVGFTNLSLNQRQPIKNLTRRNNVKCESRTSERTTNYGGFVSSEHRFSAICMIFPKPYAKWDTNIYSQPSIEPPAVRPVRIAGVVIFIPNLEQLL